MAAALSGSWAGGGEDDGYRKIREHTGLGWHGNRIKPLLEHGAAIRRRQGWDEFVRSMPDEEWPAFIDGYCATTPEGEATKSLLLELRAAYDAERTAARA